MIGGALRERSQGAVAVIAGAILVAAMLLTLTGTAAVLARGAASAAPSADITAGPGAGEVSRRPPATAPPGDPIRVRIPAIDVVADLVPLGLNPDGTLEVPQFDEAGWYARGSRPGDPGPAVIAAHVDSTAGPAVFHRLQHLKQGDVVHVDYPDGVVTFAVRESRSFAKSRFPTRLVYGWTDGPELRLVTCDGTFDRSVGAYNSNLVVWANVDAPT